MKLRFSERAQLSKLTRFKCSPFPQFEQKLPPSISNLLSVIGGKHSVCIFVFLGLQDGVPVLPYPMMKCEETRPRLPRPHSILGHRKTEDCLLYSCFCGKDTTHSEGLSSGREEGREN